MKSISQRTSGALRFGTIKFSDQSATRNPKGRPKVAPEIELARLSSELELTKSPAKLMFMTKGELRDLISTPTSRAVESLLSIIILGAIELGCVKRCEFLFKYFIGPPSNPKFSKPQQKEEMARPVEIIDKNPYSVEIWNSEKGRYESYGGGAQLSRVQVQLNMS